MVHARCFRRSFNYLTCLWTTGSIISTVHSSFLRLISSFEISSCLGTEIPRDQRDVCGLFEGDILRPSGLEQFVDLTTCH